MTEPIKEDLHSTVRLNTFCVYRGAKGTNEIEILAGASASRKREDGVIELLSDSVPYHSKTFQNKRPKDGAGLLMLYGTRDSLEEIQYWRMYAREHKAEFASAEFDVDVGVIESGLTDRALLKKMKGTNRFLNVRRMKADFQKDVLLSFQQYAEAEAVFVDVEKVMGRVSQIATRPDFFDQLLYEDPDLSKLDVLVIPVADDPRVPGKMRQVAYVKPGAKIIATAQGSELATIVLPSWMDSLKAARAYQKKSNQELPD